jgi:hypothetical protein
MIVEIINQLERILEYVENLDRRITVLEEELLNEEKFAIINSGEDKLRDIKKRLNNKYMPSKGISYLKEDR